MQLRNMLEVVGCHAAGEIGNVVVSGVDSIPGDSMFDKRNHLQNHRDDIRKLLLHEPRGSVACHANILFPSAHPEADMGFVILEPTEYPAMSGSNTMCVATVLLETGILPMQEPLTTLTLESPAGLIRVECECRDGQVKKVRFTNQPAFAYHLGAEVDVPDLGRLTVDVAWGGMAYVLVDAASLGYHLIPEEAGELAQLGQKIKASAAEQLRAVHPTHPEYPGITQTEFTTPVETIDGVLTARNGVVISPGRFDRSPCGTGTSARLAVLHARGEIAPGQLLRHDSITGSRFEASITATTMVCEKDAVIPTVSGTAWITGTMNFGIAPGDPFPEGYIIGDTWLNES